MFLKDIIEKERFSFHEGFDDYKEAIKVACDTLVQQGAVKDIYVDEIYKKIDDLGPYIVIAPGICIPHAQEGFGVNETCMSFMNTQNPVHFSDDPDQDANLFFVLASENNDKHLENLMELSDLLGNDEAVEMLKKATSKEDLLKVLEKIG